jgi:hypothetical protein
MPHKFSFGDIVRYRPLDRTLIAIAGAVQACRNWSHDRRIEKHLGRR